MRALHAEPAATAGTRHHDVNCQLDDCYVTNSICAGLRIRAPSGHSCTASFHSPCSPEPELDGLPQFSLQALHCKAAAQDQVAYQASAEVGAFN